jgi:hypothetical protein
MMRVPGGIGFIACQNAVMAHAVAIAISASRQMRRGRASMAMARLPDGP